MKATGGGLVLAVATAAVAASIVAGVILVGTPDQGRIERLDTERIEDLKGIMQAIDRFWKDSERLPATLLELAENPRSEANTLDPGSVQSYEYHVLDEDTYQLCAVFDRESRMPSRTPADFWSHGVGRQCFELDVSKTDGEAGGSPPAVP